MASFASVMASFASVMASVQDLECSGVSYGGVYSTERNGTE